MSESLGREGITLTVVGSRGCVKQSSKLGVMVSLGHQLDYIWNELKSKELGESVREFSWLDYLRWKTHSKSGLSEVKRHTLDLVHSFWGAVYIKGNRREPVISVCLASRSLENSSYLETFLHCVRTFFFLIPAWIENWQFSGTFPGLQHHIGMLRHPVSWTEEPADSWPFHQETAIVLCVCVHMCMWLRHHLFWVPEILIKKLYNLSQLRNPQPLTGIIIQFAAEGFSDSETSHTQA